MWKPPHDPLRTDCSSTGSTQLSMLGTMVRFPRSAYNTLSRYPVPSHNICQLRYKIGGTVAVTSRCFSLKGSSVDWTKQRGNLFHGHEVEVTGSSSSTSKPRNIKTVITVLGLLGFTVCIVYEIDTHLNESILQRNLRTGLTGAQIAIDYK